MRTSVVSGLVVLACSIGCSTPQEWEIASRKLLAVGLTGSGCEEAPLLGAWNPDTSTCTMTRDLVSEGLRIDSDGITLDCAGYSICNPDTSVGPASCDNPEQWGNVGLIIEDGILNQGHSQVTIRNCTTKGFFYGVRMAKDPGGPDLTGILMENVKMTGSSDYSNADPTDGSSYMEPREGLKLDGVVSSTFRDLEVSWASHRAINVINNHHSSTWHRILIHHCVELGMDIYTGGGSVLRHDNLFEDLEFRRHQTKMTDRPFAFNFRVLHSVVRRVLVRPEPGILGATFGSGIQFAPNSEGAGANNRLEDAVVIGAFEWGIIDSTTETPRTPAIDLTVSQSTVLSSGGGFRSSSGRDALIGSTFCYSGSKPIFGIATSDITRVWSADGSTMVGAGNTCDDSVGCAPGASPGIWSCGDEALANHDVGAPAGSFCHNRCGP